MGTDCSGGGWAACTDVCETAEERVWVEERPASGFGRLCDKPAPFDCRLGEGTCAVCRYERIQDRLLNGCETLPGFDYAMTGFCRADGDARVNARMLDGVYSVEECASYCDDSCSGSPGAVCCSGIAYGFVAGGPGAVYRRCFIYGPGQDQGLPVANPSNTNTLQWSGYHQDATMVVHASGTGGILCAAKTGGSSGGR